MNSITVSEWNLSTEEIGFYVGKYNKNIEEMDSIHVHIPKILPLVAKGKEIEMKESLSKAYLLNDNECDIDISNNVEIVNYVSINIPDNLSFKRPLFKYDAKLKIGFVSGNVDNGKLLDVIDSSEYENFYKE